MIAPEPSRPHGVLADPFFRYSIRVDGVFERDFVRALERAARG